ncbi:MAG: YbbR-like domain-containing protein [Candidatus Zixiibacteriota bacterium]|nr:MAG: YbbR-like domain-containing protein [candidate division Zixibacteria bacterium]
MMKILDHFWLKVTALILGLLLWFHVATEKTYNYELPLPLEEVSLEQGLALSQAPPDSIMAVVSATGKQLLRQKWRERGLRVVATQFSSGRHELQLTTSNTFLISPSADVSLDEIVSPSSVTLQVDRRSEVMVRVEPDIITEPADGFAVSEITAGTPPEVKLIGPQSAIRRITEVHTVTKELAELRNTLTLTLPLAAPDSYGVTLEPDSVTVTVRVVPVKTRVFEDVPVVIYNSPPGQGILAQPPSVRIELTGPPEDIDLLNRNALIASVDYTKTDSITGRTLLKIDCPPKFRVRRASVDSVTLTAE